MNGMNKSALSEQVVSVVEPRSESKGFTLIRTFFTSRFEKLYRSFEEPCQGFTLIELMVVVAVIAILATIGLVIFSGVQQRARDAKRQEDVQAIVKGLEVNKTQGATNYSQIQSSWFGGNAVPVEAVGYIPQYTLIYSSAGVPTSITLSSSSTWPATTANIAISNFTTVPTTGITLSSITVANGSPSSTSFFTAFQVCARLETGIVYCQPSSQ